MEIKCFLIMIIIVLTIYLIFCYDSSYYNSENFQNGTSLSNEAIQNITGIYNKNNMIVTNLNTTGLSTMKDATIIVEALSTRSRGIKFATVDAKNAEKIRTLPTIAEESVENKSDFLSFNLST